LKRTSKSAVVAYIRMPSGIFRDGLRKPTKISVWIAPICGPRFATGTFRIRSRCVNHCR